MSNEPEEGELLGYAIYEPHNPDNTDARMECLSCHDGVEDEMQKATIRDQPSFGAAVPYPECRECGEVMRP